MTENLEIRDKVSFLKQVSVFEDVPSENLEMIAGALHEKKVVAAETIFKKDEDGDTLYIIAEGKVRVHDGNHVLGRLAAGEVFGEFSLFDHEKRSASVTAEEKSTLYLLAQDDFYHLLTTNSSVMHGVMRVLTGRLRYMNELENKLSKSFLKIRKQKEEIQKRNENINKQKAELEEKNRQLKHINDEKNHLIEIIAHDLKNPLASSICVTDLLSDKLNGNDKSQSEALEVMNNSLKNMNNIVNQILDVHELNTKNLHLKLKPVNLAILIKEILENYSYAISRKEIDVNFSQKNTSALVDPNLAKLVFENLIFNFIKQAKDFGSISINFEESKEKICIVITDNTALKTTEQYRKLYGLYQKPSEEQLKKFPTTEDSIIVKYVVAMKGTIKKPTINKGMCLKIYFNKPIVE